MTPKWHWSNHVSGSEIGRRISETKLRKAAEDPSYASRLKEAGRKGGNSHTPEQRRLHGLLTKRLHEQGRFDMDLFRANALAYGRSEEGRKTRSENGKERRKDPVYAQKMADVVKRRTEPELIMERILLERSIEYKIQVPIRAEGIWTRADFFVPSRNLVIFVDGWHYHHEIRGVSEKDLQTTLRLSNEGYTIARIPHFGRERDLFESDCRKILGALGL